MKNVLITGGTGLIGMRLTKALQQEGYNVSHLSRTKSPEDIVPTYLWDIDMGYIEEEAFNNVDIIVHLAGAGIADKRWTEERKKEIIGSRSGAADLIFDYVNRKEIKLQAFISASGIGIYGMITTEKIFHEEDLLADDFLGEVCRLWEESADKFKSLGLRVVKIRTSVVLAKEGGALPKLIMPIKWFVGSPIGSGMQYMPWIHIEDLVQIYVKAIKEKDMNGAYNAVAPEHVNNTDMTKAIAKMLKRPLFMPNVPSFVLRIIFGKMAEAILHASRVSSEKIQRTGYRFKFPSLKEALGDLLKAKS